MSCFESNIIGKLEMTGVMSEELPDFARQMNPSKLLRILSRSESIDSKGI